MIGTASEPVALGTRRELFVDRYLVERLEGADLKLHHPVSAGPAFTFDRPWEGAFSGYCTVIPADDHYLLTYRGYPGQKGTDEWGAVTCVAESDDGRIFERPSVGLYEVHGTRENNVILTCAEDMYTHNFAPLLDLRPGVPADERFKALTRNYGWAFIGQRTDPMALFAFVSPDGIRWRKFHDEPVITKGKLDSQNVAFWSDHEQCYLCYLRESTVSDYIAGVRSIARCRSDDFLQWTEPVLMDMGDTPPEHLYTNQTQPYFRAPHIYVALPGRFMPGRQVLNETEGERFGVCRKPDKPGGYWEDCSDAVLMTSRGGNRYDRTFMESFIRPGRDRRNWTSRCNYPVNGIVQTAEDEISLYVERHNAQDGKYLERMTLRLDGFASLSAGYGGGEMVTRPVTFTGNRLTLNYASSAAGSIRVELQDADGYPLPETASSACPEIIGDEMEREVCWKNGPDLTSFAGRPVRLRFMLKDADLYAFRFCHDSERAP